jgi:hypothetical protein
MAGTQQGWRSLSSGGSGTGVQSVTGLSTDNTDPQNPVVNIEVDNTTITGAGTPASPLQSNPFPPMYYGSFSDYQQQVIVNPLNEQLIKISTQDLENNVELVDRTARFRCSRTGSVLDVLSISSGTVSLGMIVVGGGWGTCLFDGQINGNILTVSSVSSGTLTAGMYIEGTGATNCYISYDINGGGGTGDYYISVNQSVLTTTFNGYDIIITDFVTGTGGTGKYETSTTGIIPTTDCVARIPSIILFRKAGLYNFQFSAQFQNTDNQENEANVWLRKNDLDVEGSNGFFSIIRTNSGVDGKTIACWNYFLNIRLDGDYVELVFSVNNSAVTIASYPLGSSPIHPITPSMLVTTNRIG